jgi:rubrerythrin
MRTREELNAVIDVARKTEIDGRKFYAETAARTQNPLARKMFESLVTAEEKHLKLIEQLARGEFDSDPYNHEFRKHLTTLFSGMPSEVKDQAGKTDDDIAALDFAIDLEDKSMAFYREWAEKASDEQVKAFCARMRDEEEDHWNVLQSTKEYLGETGNWFMVQEGWSFDGG